MHLAALENAGAEAFEVRTLADIDSADALVLPGGESTVMGGLLVRFGLMDRLHRSYSVRVARLRNLRRPNTSSGEDRRP